MSINGDNGDGDSDRDHTDGDDDGDNEEVSAGLSQLPQHEARTSLSREKLQPCMMITAMFKIKTMMIMMIFKSGSE